MACANTDAANSAAVGDTVAVELIRAAQLSHIADSLARTTRTGHTIGAHPTFQYLEVRRASNGVAEVHDRWIDVMFVQSGKGTWLIGGHVRGSYVESPGEHRGGTIVGASPHPVASGDLLIIPSGTPHQLLLSRGDSLRYITVKVVSSR